MTVNAWLKTYLKVKINQINEMMISKEQLKFIERNKNELNKVLKVFFLDK